MPLKELINDAERYINETKPGQSTVDDRDRREIAIEQLSNLKWHIDSFHHTIKYGFVGIAFTAGLFIMFISLLYLHKLWHSQTVFFNVSFTISIIVVSYLVWFIYVVLKKEGEVFSMKEQLPKKGPKMKILLSLIVKAIKNAALALLFFAAFLAMLYLITPLFNLYVSPRESIIDMGKFVHIVINKQNNLKLYMGHSDSETGWVEDNYTIAIDKIDDFAKVYFGIENINIDDNYKTLRLFIEFDNENEKIDGKDGGTGGWVKFKDNNFNYGIVSEVLPATRVQLNSVALRFPKKGTYRLKYGISANGYRTKFGTKTINVI